MIDKENKTNYIIIGIFQGGDFMIKCNLSSLMGRDRKKIQDVCNETGLARNTVANLYYDRAKRVDYDTLNQLCRMFRCTMGELYSYEEDDSGSVVSPE